MNRLQKLVFLRINDILGDSILVPNGNSLWITNPNIDDWFFEYKNDGSLIFNGLIFHRGLIIFSLNRSEISVFLKKWFEIHFSLMVRGISKKNSNMDYYLEKISKKRDDWTIEKRFGFTFETVKRYLNIKNESEIGKTELRKFIYS